MRLVAPAALFCLVAELGCADPWEPPAPDLETRARATAEVARLAPLIANGDASFAAAQLEHADRRVRRAALLRLMDLAEVSSPHVPAMIARLSDEHPRVRTAAARALAAAGDERAFRPLVDALADENRTVRTWVWKSILAAGEPIIPAVIARLGDDGEDPGYVNEAKRRVTLRAELRLRCPTMGKRIVPALAGALKDEDLARKEAAAFILGEIGAQADGALPDLASALESEADVELRREIVEALGKIGDKHPRVIPALDAASKDADEKLAALAKKTLSKLRKPADGAKKKKKKGAAKPAS